MRRTYSKPIGYLATCLVGRILKLNQLRSEQTIVDLHRAFRIGAKRIAESERAYTELHKAHGIEEAHWKLLTQAEYWTPDQARAIRSILANVIEVSMTIAGMPPVPLPGQYAAALIAEVVSPCNRMLACVKAPDTFDAAMASGFMGSPEVKDMTPQQLMALVIAYSGDFPNEPPSGRLNKTIVEAVSDENKSTRKKAMA